MDIEEEVEGGELAPLTLVGSTLDGKERDVALISQDLIRQSSFLMGIRWSDKTTRRVVVKIYPEILHLLVRFGNLVLEHNRMVVKGGVSALRSLPVVNMPAHLGSHNRAMHLPVIIGNSPQLAEFLDLVAERPYVACQCAVAAEMMLWEPAQSAFLYKFGNLLRGMSHPFMELVFPSGFFLNHLQPSCTKNEQEILTALTLTNKFFQEKPAINNKLLPPTPLPLVSMNKKTSKKVQTKSTAPIIKPPALPRPSAPPHPAKRPTSIKNALQDLDRWIAISSF